MIINAVIPTKEESAEMKVMMLKSAIVFHGGIVVSLSGTEYHY